MPFLVAAPRENDRLPNGEIDRATETGQERWMHWSRWVVLALTLLRSGWMTFDGVRALTVGDYLTPREGGHAGRLGPWAPLVENLGISPRSTGMKLGFVLFGIFGVAAIVSSLARVEWSWHALLVASILTLWYLPIGTILSAAVIVLLVAFR